MNACATIQRTPKTTPATSVGTWCRPTQRRSRTGERVSGTPGSATGRWITRLRERWSASRRSGTGSRAPILATCAEEVRELSGADVAAAQDERDAPAAQPVAELERRRERRGAGVLGQVARVLEHEHDRATDLVLAHEHEVVEQLPHDSLWELEGDARREALGRGRRRAGDRLARAPRMVRGRRRLRLDADHLDLGPGRLRDDARACGAAAAAD